MINVANTCIGQPFRTWVKEQMRLRNERLVKEEDWIQVDEAVYRAFKNSTNISRKYPVLV